MKLWKLIWHFWTEAYDRDETVQFSDAAWKLVLPGHVATLARDCWSIRTVNSKWMILSTVGGTTDHSATRAEAFSRPSAQTIIRQQCACVYLSAQGWGVCMCMCAVSSFCPVYFILPATLRLQSTTLAVPSHLSILVWCLIMMMNIHILMHYHLTNYCADKRKL